MDHETLSLLSREFTRYSAAHYGVPRLRQYMARDEGRDPALWTQLCANGWTALGLPEDCGGFGDRLTDSLPLFIAAGRDLWREPLLEWCGATVGALRALAGSGASLLTTLIDGSRPVCFVHRESQMGFVTDSLPNTVDRGDGRLSGAKCGVIDYTPDATLIVTARDGDRCATYLVAANAPGLTAHAYRTVDARSVSDLVFDDVPAQALGPAREVIRAATRRMQLLAAAELVGVIEGTVAVTREHLLNRQQFGRPLASLQLLQHRLVDMYMAGLETAALTNATAQAYDAEAVDLDFRLLTLRAHSASAARQVTQAAIQLHGGLGLCSEVAVGHYYRRTLAIDSLCGTADWALNCLAAIETSTGVHA